MWPKPTGHVSVGDYVAHLDPEKINLHGIDLRSSVGDLLTKNINLLKLNTKKMGSNSLREGGLALGINIVGLSNPNDVRMTLQTKENYILQIFQPDVEMVIIVVFIYSLFDFFNLFVLILTDKCNDNI